MGKLILSNQPCPSCSSSDAFCYYEEEDERTSGYCYSCKTSIYNVDKPEGSGRKVYQPRNLLWVEENAAFMDIPHRGISKEVAKSFGVRASVDEKTGVISHLYYPLTKEGTLVGYKEREVGTKSFTVIGEGKKVELFGRKRAGEDGKLLIITEGEDDAMAATELLKRRGKNYRVVSLPNGANASSVRDNITWIEKFDNVFLSLDQDDIGKKAALEISTIITPGKVKVMTYSEKDACDMLAANKDQEYFNSVYSAQEIRPDSIKGVLDLKKEAMEPAVMGYSWPWETLTKATFGYRRKELYGFGAGSGAGKTEAFKEIITHVIYEHNNTAGIIFLEENPAKTIKVIAGKRLNKRFHVPNADWTLEELESGIDDLIGKMYLFDHFGGKSWEHIKSQIRYMAISLGIKDIFLDHLTALVAQEDNEYKALNRIMEELASLTQELDITIFFISHLRKASGTPHEEGGHVSGDQFKGSGSIVYWSNFLFGIERNQLAEDSSERNTSIFRVLKDRYTGLGMGTAFKLWYDHETGRWREKTESDGFDNGILE